MDNRVFSVSSGGKDSLAAKPPELISNIRESEVGSLANTLAAGECIACILRSTLALFLAVASGELGGEIGLCGNAFENSGSEDSASTGADMENGARDIEGRVLAGKLRASGPDFNTGGVGVRVACANGLWCSVMPGGKGKSEGEPDCGARAMLEGENTLDSVAVPKAESGKSSVDLFGISGRLIVLAMFVGSAKLCVLPAD